MSQIADVGLVLTLQGGHPVMVVSDYPAAATDPVIFVNFTTANVGAFLFARGHSLSGGFTFSNDSTVFLQIQEVSRFQADGVVSKSVNCGFATLADVKTVRDFLGQNKDKISSKVVREYISGQGW